MYESENQAKVAFDALRENTPKIGQFVGDHLASVALRSTHGRRTEADKDGHFDLYEFAGTNLVPVSDVVDKL